MYKPYSIKLFLCTIFSTFAYIKCTSTVELQMITLGRLQLCTTQKRSNKQCPQTSDALSLESFWFQS